LPWSIWAMIEKFLMFSVLMGELITIANKR
jgi:hypothetical protein